MKETVNEGVVVEFNGKYWGTQWKDGQSTCKEYGPIEKAEISEAKYCKQTTDLTHDPKYTCGINPDYKSLQKGKFVKIRKTTIYEIID